MEGKEGLPMVVAAENYATLLISHHSFKADVAQLGQAGHPAMYERSALPTKESPGLISSLFSKRASANKVKVARMRLQMQFPRALLSDPQTVVVRTAYKTVEELEKVQRSRPNRKYVTVFEAENLELVGVRDKEPLCRVVAQLFNGSDISDVRLFYPAQSVVAATKWSSSVTASGTGVASAAASTPVKWTTLSILTPSSASNAKQTNSISREDKERYLSTFSARPPTSEELVQDRLFEPSKEAEATLDSILHHLYRRGCIWTRAAHRSRPSLRNPHPKTRPEFMVQGLFPEAFLSRCKRYQANDNMPMPSDMDEEKEKEKPLITTLVGLFDSEEETMQSESSLAVVDALQGCSVRVSPEPYRGAGFFEEIAAPSSVS